MSKVHYMEAGMPICKRHKLTMTTLKQSLDILDRYRIPQAIELGGKMIAREREPVFEALHKMFLSEVKIDQITDHHDTEALTRLGWHRNEDHGVWAFFTLT